MAAGGQEAEEAAACSSYDLFTKHQSKMQENKMYKAKSKECWYRVNESINKISRSIWTEDTAQSVLMGIYTLCTFCCFPLVSSSLGIGQSTPPSRCSGYDSLKTNKRNMGFMAVPTGRDFDTVSVSTCLFFLSWQRSEVKSSDSSSSVSLVWKCRRESQRPRDNVQCCGPRITVHIRDRGGDRGTGGRDGKGGGTLMIKVPWKNRNTFEHPAETHICIFPPWLRLVHLCTLHARRGRPWRPRRRTRG